MLHLVALSAIALLSTAPVNAHMIMQTPTPFNNETIDNSPLQASGSNFPCKSTGQADFYTVKYTNTMAVGETQTLSFKGSAVHGGGSCQLAITSDKAPTPSTTWQVIQSIEGGCPSKTGDGPSTYDFSIPDGVAPGNYIFAWTWISKLAGQPEYYMNCAPITVTGSKKRSTAKRAPSLPNLAVYNLASVNSCKTSPGTDPVYPDPGPNVVKPNPSASYATPAGTNCFPVGATGGASSGGSPSAAAGGSGGSSSSNTSPAAGPANAASSAVSSPGSSNTATSTVSLPSAGATTTALASSVPADTAAPTSTLPAALSSGGVFAPNASSATTFTSSIVPTTLPAIATSSAVPASNSSSSGSTSGLTGSCSTEGMWNCLAGTSFQRCASGAWSAVMAMPAGTSCTPGQSQSLFARSVRRVRRIV